MEAIPSAPVPARLDLKSFLGGGAPDLKRALGNIFEGAKGAVFEEVGKSQLAQEAKAAEIKRMLPMIVAGIVVVLVVGYFFGRRS